MREHADKLTRVKKERKEPQVTTGGPLLTNEQYKELEELKLKKKMDAQNKNRQLMMERFDTLRQSKEQETAEEKLLNREFEA